jgi:AraC family transcriptional regulator
MRSDETRTPTDEATHHLTRLQHGACSYARCLAAVGGEQLQASLRAGGDQSVVAALYRSPPYELDVPPMSVWRLSLNLTAAEVRGGIGGRDAARFEAGRYSLFMTPAGAPARWHKSSPSRHVAIYYGPGALRSDDEPALGSVLLGERPLLNLTVPGLRPWVDQLVEELNRADEHQGIAIDSIARMLLVRVSRHVLHAPGPAQGVDAATMARLHDYVREHLGERLRVADLAAQAGMPAFRFTQACRQQTGLLPHEFVMAVRLERTRHLLRSTSLSLAEIAQACGFSSQQHLTHAMRRHTGTTPARYRFGRIEQPAL